MDFEVSQHLVALQKRVENATRAAGRKHPPTILAVAKKQPIQKIYALAALGQVHFAHNYVQEGVGVIQQLLAQPPHNPLEWHFIGPLQANKTALVAQHFSWVHSLDRLSIAERLATQRPHHLPPLKVFLQVNTSGEISKSGVPPAQLFTLAKAVAGLPRLQLCGLMTIPSPLNAQNAALVAAEFAQLAALSDMLITHGIAATELSMGMSADVELAIAAGSTWLRIGTALFGERQ